MQLEREVLLDLVKSTRIHSEERIKALGINLHKYKQANTKPPQHLLVCIENHTNKLQELNELENEIKNSNRKSWRI
ncbi:hypothetical protein WKM37_000057 [Listeria monocytogenes]|uniref:Uncharacterized protein n=1 Tax=Listeria monocytogenes TaxID=1639 RepID=A0A473XLT4_LISMN|nr:hypothetical protein [Listeria monocytogenes]EAC5129659.1 hypothetical protein [Listeria monocytogenes]EAC9467673.1 hypothetical protein [Listeria monocytogenes]EAD0460505.1 hypothetical protein [Listeria monocytogenes]EAD6997181.1 hypothetical protein [Listeria monocytogenes]EAD9986416.1 hypothetical protein [Listeria monocytogenes]